MVSRYKSSEGGRESELARETNIEVEVEGILWSLGLVETETGLMNTDAICQTLGMQENLFLNFTFLSQGFAWFS